MFKNKKEIAAAVGIGALIGVLIGILFAPEKGKETRSKISDEATNLWNKLKEFLR